MQVLLWGTIAVPIFYFYFYCHVKDPASGHKKQSSLLIQTAWESLPVALPGLGFPWETSQLGSILLSLAMVEMTNSQPKLSTTEELLAELCFI